MQNVFVWVGVGDTIDIPRAYRKLNFPCKPLEYTFRSYNELNIFKKKIAILLMMDGAGEIYLNLSLNEIKIQFILTYFHDLY